MVRVVKVVLNDGVKNGTSKQGYGDVKISRGTIHKVQPDETFDKVFMEAKSTFDKLEALRQEEASLSKPTDESFSEVVEKLNSLFKVDIDERKLQILRGYNAKQLESVLGVDGDYYRERYYALLMLVALSFNDKLKL